MLNKKFGIHSVISIVNIFDYESQYVGPKEQYPLYGNSIGTLIVLHQTSRATVPHTGSGAISTGPKI